jgi:hypothetical protein
MSQENVEIVPLDHQEPAKPVRNLQFAVETCDSR